MYFANVEFILLRNNWSALLYIGPPMLRNYSMLVLTWPYPSNPQYSLRTGTSTTPPWCSSAGRWQTCGLLLVVTHRLLSLLDGLATFEYLGVLSVWLLDKLDDHFGFLDLRVGIPHLLSQTDLGPGLNRFFFSFYQLLFFIYVWNFKIGSNFKKDAYRQKIFHLNC